MSGDQPPDRAGRLRGVATRAAVVTLVVAAMVATLALIIVTAQIWLLIFAGLLLAVLLSSAADTASRWLALPHGWSLALVLLALLLATYAAGVVLWPSISAEAEQLARDLPAAVQDLRTWLADRAWGAWLLGQAEADRVVPEDAVSKAGGALTSTAGAIGALLVILFVGIYVASQPTLYHHGLRRLLPTRARDRADEVIHEVVGVLRWWLVGKLLSMTVVGVLTTCGLWLLGVPLALTFGLLAAVLTFVPNFGPILSVVPPALLAVTDDPGLAGYVIALYLLIQTVESYAITPLIQRRTVSMPPALTITAQLVLGVLVGAIGVAVATPLTAVAMTAIRRLYVEDLLERQGAADPAAPPA